MRDNAYWHVAAQSCRMFRAMPTTLRSTEYLQRHYVEVFRHFSAAGRSHRAELGTRPLPHLPASRSGSCPAVIQWQTSECHRHQAVMIDVCAYSKHLAGIMVDMNITAVSFHMSQWFNDPMVHSIFYYYCAIISDQKALYRYRYIDLLCKQTGSFVRHSSCRSWLFNILRLLQVLIIPCRSDAPSFVRVCERLF